MTECPDCYGKMFPDVLHLPSNRPVSGKVFTVQLDRAGGFIRSDRRITADLKEWEKCLECPLFDECYKFSMAHVTLASAIATQ